jgi:DNA repair photolyase
VNVLTKSARVMDDVDVFEGRNVRVGVTITTPDEHEARAWEPRASSVAERLEVLREAKSLGLETVVMFGPLLPGVSDTRDALVRLFELAREVDVDRVWTDTLNRRPMVWPAVRAFLRTHRPDLLPMVQRVLFDARYRCEYERQVARRVEEAARETGMNERMG